ncbi:hypothetical protein HMPREF9599_00563 [Cutibacterium acnes HL050PA2]|nr:hypothetical protein HMPREF9599_00563 [Cutibacterium acnes HL050PA2]
MPRRLVSEAGDPAKLYVAKPGHSAIEWHGSAAMPPEHHGYDHY